ncbi:MAG: glycosyltransferase [Heliobacteriaceae bacterium]|jgi:glycosyltransferase involved in cell wall biosynthesis|nr:glycosyltransferase [Heliobacteriaceae bacterium]
MEKPPKISVIMSAYNAEQYISEAIESILNQTFSDFEFIIINDGSTDNTAGVIKSFKDERIVFVDSLKNIGMISALNKALDSARGEYIARMDADDISLPERFARQLEFMDTNPDVGVLGAQMQTFGLKNWISNYPEQVSYFDLVCSCCMSHPTAMFRSSVFNKYNLRYAHGYEAAEDYEFWSRIIRDTKICNLPEVLLKYRWHGNNISVEKKELQQEADRRIKNNMLEFLTNEPWRDKTLKFVKKYKDKVTTLSFDFLKIKRSYGNQWSKWRLYVCYLPLITIVSKAGKTTFKFLGIPVFVSKRNFTFL